MINNNDGERQLVHVKVGDGKVFKTPFFFTIIEESNINILKLILPHGKYVQGREG